MNNLLNISELHNQYFVMRHGQSKANEQDIIISYPENGILADYALTELGRQQAKDSAENSALDADTIIVSSDFSRAKETAEIVRTTLGAAPIELSVLLRERNFGDWEKQDHSHYHDVWKYDEHDAEQQNSSVESVNAVLSRAKKLISDLELRYKGRKILLVSHGDCLQILQTGFQKIDPSQHRSLQHLETAEIRAMKFDA